LSINTSHGEKNVIIVSQEDNIRQKQQKYLRSLWLLAIEH